MPSMMEYVYHVCQKDDRRASGKKFCLPGWGVYFALRQEIANKLKMDCSYLARTLQLANLAPDIVKLIWENRHPETLTLDNLRKGIPESWKEQRKLFYENYACHTTTRQA